MRVEGLGSRIGVSGSWVSGSRFKVQGSGFRVQSSGFRVQGLGFRVSGLGFGVSGIGRPKRRRSRASIPSRTGGPPVPAQGTMRNSDPGAICTYTPRID